MGKLFKFWSDLNKKEKKKALKQIEIIFVMGGLIILLAVIVGCIFI